MEEKNIKLRDFLRSVFRTLADKLSLMLTASSDKNKWSTARFSMIVTMALSNIIVWGGVSCLLIFTGKFPDVPTSVITLYALANGIVLGGKVTQAVFGENNKDNSQS